MLQQNSDDPSINKSMKNNNGKSQSQLAPKGRGGGGGASSLMGANKNIPKASKAEIDNLVQMLNEKVSDWCVAVSTMTTSPVAVSCLLY